VHRWSSLVCTVFLLSLCLTGLPLIFHDEIDDYLAPVPAPRPEGTGDPPSLEALAAALAQRFPGELVRFAFWPDDRLDLVGFGLAPTEDAGLDQVRRVTVDRRSGEILDERDAESGLTHALLELHAELFSGLAGSVLLGVMGILFVVAVVSGCVLYRPYLRKVPFGALRTDRRRRIVWLDLHNLLGIVTAAWALLVGLTGIMNTMEAPLFAAWQAETVPALRTSDGGPAGAGRGALDRAVAEAHRALPGAIVTSVGYPGSPFGLPSHYLVWTKGATPLKSRLFTPIVIDAATGTRSRVLDMPWYLRALELSRPLHFADYGGLALKIAWAVLDLATIAVLISGLRLWLGRRNRPSTRKTPQAA
jgi:uncharacterized iron-regulated membrane protein